MGVKGFVEGGIASVVAGCSTHPLDLIKVRMQLQGEQTVRPAFAFANVGAGYPVTELAPRNRVGPISVGIRVVQTEGVSALLGAGYPVTELAHRNRVGPISVGIRVVQTEGVSALFSGVSATMLRQVLYSTTRMGLYEILKEKWREPGSTQGNLPLVKKITAGLIAGGIGAAVGNPADVAMVRMQADGRLPVAQRRNYTSVADAIGRMVRQDGITSLWTGSSLTVQRAMIVTASQLASYDQIKETLISHGIMKDGVGTHVTASFSAGFVAAVASNPVDVIKTRIMNMNPKPGQPAPYSGALDCAMKTIKAEGPMALYKGFIPTVMRQGPFTVVLFVTLEQVRKIFKDLNF